MDKMNLKILAVLLMFVPSVSFAAVDIFLKIDDVKGESVKANHIDEIDVLAWSWGASTSGNRKTCIQDLSLTKFIDLSSPALLMGQARGRMYDQAILTVSRGNANSLAYISIKFKNVTVTSLSTGGSGGEDRLTENVTFNFESATFEYTPQLQDGVAGETVSAEIYPSRCK